MQHQMLVICLVNLVAAQTEKYTYPRTEKSSTIQRNLCSIVLDYL